MNEAVRDFFAQEINLLTAKTPAGTGILLSRVPLMNPDIGDQSAFISKEVPSEQILKILDTFLKLESGESYVSLIPDAQTWELTQQSKTKITDELEQFLASKVRSSVQQKISHCADELISNAIYATDPKQKTSGGSITNEKPVQILLSLDSEINILVIRDQYGAIDQNAKSHILSKITQETIAPQMKREEGGAGIGLNLVREFCDFLIIRHHSGQWTEICCFFSKKHLSQTPFLFMEV